MQLEIKDKQGTKTLRYEEAVKYHGGFHVAGVALGWKFLEGAMAKCGGVLARENMQLTLGASPPGVVDCLEYATRALSRRRAIVAPGFLAGPEVCCGTLSFALKYGPATVTASLRGHVLPREFVDTAIRIDAGVADAGEIEDWRSKSIAMSGQFMEKRPRELFEMSLAETSEESGATPLQATPLVEYDAMELPPLRIRDDNLVAGIRLEEMVRFHDKDHYAGVVMAYKLLSLAFQELWGEDTPLRRDITILTGLNPPGLMDSFEYVARSVTRQRHCLVSQRNGAPMSPFGQFVFQVQNGDAHSTFQLRPGLLPDDFTSVGRKAEAGLADSEEQLRWGSYKYGVGKTLAAMDSSDIFERVQ